MKSIICSSLFLSLVSCAAVPARPIATNVHGLDVTYKGIYQNEIEGFIGVRYALDTSNENRFRPPVPFVPAPKSTMVASKPGPSCPQKLSRGVFGVWSTYDYITDISEDCLRLNIWRPNGTTAGDKLPVLLYIHGGSFITGNKDGTLSQPGGMQLKAIDNGHPIMNVEINYRLGVFGFAQTDALLKEGSANAGARDQRLAIEWVKENIEAFGGDPDKITIHGQSSGGLAMGIQILAYGGTKPVPFNQAIAESQVLEPGITGNYTRHSTARAWHLTSCQNMTFDSAENADCLRHIPMGELLQGELITHTAALGQNQGDNWLPVVDGDFLPDVPSKLIAEHRFANVSTIMGWTEADAELFTTGHLVTEHDTYKWLRAYLPEFSEAQLTKLQSLYPSSDFHTTYFNNGNVKQQAQFYRTARIYRDILFTCQPIYMGGVMASVGNDVYYYNQNQSMLQPVLHSEGAYGWGPVHTSELIYVFGNITKFDLPASGVGYHPTASDHRLAHTESKSWSSFVAVGKPSLEGHDTLPGWELADFNDENFGVYVIGGNYSGYSGTGSTSSPEARMAMAKEDLQARCGFLNAPEQIKALQY